MNAKGIAILTVFVAFWICKQLVERKSPTLPEPKCGKLKEKK